MSAPFQSGDVVSVIDASPARWHEPKNETLVVGDVFTVRHFERGIPFGWGFPRAFIVRNCDPGLENPCWDARRFRKIDDEVTEEFRERLRKLPVRAPERVS